MRIMRRLYKLFYTLHDTYLSNEPWLRDTKREDTTKIAINIYRERVSHNIKRSRLDYNRFFASMQKDCILVLDLIFLCYVQ